MPDLFLPQRPESTGQTLPNKKNDIGLRPS